EQFRDAVFRDENVGRLQVAVHDGLLKRAVHSRADLLTQSNAHYHAEPASTAVDIDGFAVDVFEDEVRRSVGSASAVEQTSDVRMLQRGENLALHAQTAVHLRREDSCAHELDGDELLILFVRALGEPYVPHAAGAEFPQESVR